MPKEADEAAPKGANGPEGVFGNLPSTRPGSRSPRRRTAPNASEPEVTSEAEAVAPKPAPASDTPARPKPKPKPQAKAQQPRPKAEPPAEPQEPAPGIHGVEDLAWAGVAVAAQAATAGVRFASRALETARKSIDRP